MCITVGVIGNNAQTNEPINQDVKPFYALKYLIDACNENGSDSGYGIPQSVLDEAIAELNTGNTSKWVLLYYFNSERIGGETIVYLHNSLSNSVPILQLFNNTYNFKQELFCAFFEIDQGIFDFQNNEFISNYPSKFVGRQPCFPKERISLYFNDITDLGFDETNVDDWNTYINSSGSNVNFDALQIVGNRVDLAGNLPDVTAFRMTNKKVIGYAKLFNLVNCKDIVLQIGQITQTVNSSDFLIGIKSISLVNNQIETLNFDTRLDQLESLQLDGNKIIDASSVNIHSKLAGLSLSQNLIENLALNSLDLLNGLEVSDNKLISLDITDNLALTTLRANGNQLGILDLSNNVALSYVELADNKLSDNTMFDGLDDLTFLTINENLFIGNLTVTNPLLTNFNFSQNKVAILDYQPTNPYLEINGSNNNLTSITLDYSKINNGSQFDFSNNLLDKDSIATILQNIVDEASYPKELFLDGTGNEDISSIPTAVANFLTIKNTGCDIRVNGVS